MADPNDIYWKIQSANEEMFPSTTPSSLTPFDPMSHARLSPGAFDPSGFSNNFILPRFASGGPTGAYAFGPAIVEPELERSAVKQSYTDYASIPRPLSSNASSLYPPRAAATSPAPPTSHDAPARNPVYTPYGSSVVAVTPSAYTKLAPQPFATPAVASSAPRVQDNIYNPQALGLPVPPTAGTSTNFAGLYSSSGFDVLSVLARVAARPNPTINIGPVDTSCAFLVVDARRYDFPIVFASETFSKLTGYSCEEIIGRNCRFLQSPDGSTAQGAPRKYTDGNAAWHMQTHIAAGKESQSSLINYMKDGKPFINLVTIVPIQWDTQEVAYYVGFQVDLVDQPNAILDRMKDGTYVVNYSLLNNPPRAMSVASTKVEESNDIEWPPEETVIKPSMTMIEAPSYPVIEPDFTSADEGAMLDTIIAEGVDGLETDSAKKQFNKLLLDNADDFIHVLSLKGSMLYCSPSAARILEYDPSELIGKTLPSLCHPSDVIPVMRELKDSGNVSHPVVSLLYRIRRKNSGYIWIEASGKLHVEPGKGRKCVILVGRPREVYKMSWHELRQAGGLGDSEFWTKLSPEGMVLNSAASVQNVLGFLPEEMVGTSLFQLIKPETVDVIRSALQECSSGSAVSIRYQIKSRRGFVEVVTRFYPRTAIPIAGDDDMDTDSLDQGPKHLSIIAQTNEISSEQRKSTLNFRRHAPAYRRQIDAATGLSDSGSSIGGGSHMQSTFKTLNHPSSVSDNVFDELDTTRCTSWQYELHQLQNINKKLREEKEHLVGRARKRKSDFDKLQIGARKKSGSSEGSSRAKKPLSCANCGRTDSPEWRAGPTGNKSLCNACGLRWAKTQRSSSAGSGTGSGIGQSSHVSAPGSAVSMTQSMDSSTSPALWR